LVKLTEIAANVGLNLFFILLARPAFEADPNSFLGGFWDPSIGIGYVFIANLAASLLKLAVLSPELRGSLGGFDWTLFRRLMRYSLPMVIIGLAGIVNEMLDRAALKYLLPGDDIANLAQLGIYSACYKLSILMTLFIQAFRYAGEPFFFAQARQANARATYAAVLNWFVIFCVFIFLLVTLYLDVFQYFVGAAYREGLRVVPVLLLASLLLGVYINLSIWYKLTDRTLMGAWVTLAGSAVTVALLFWTVPRYGYTGAAWAHLACYAVMVVLSYALGRRYYPVPYDLKRVFGYIALGLALYGVSRILVGYLHWNAPVTGTLLLAVFLVLTYGIDGRRLHRPPTAPGA
jgi:O-antigen/teichoic acid export membrane protein